MSAAQRRHLRQVVAFLWFRFNRGKLTINTLGRVLNVIDAPIPKDWR